MNFEKIRDKHPDLGEATEVLEEWIRTHPEREFLDVRSLARDLGSKVPVTEIVLVLAALVQANELEPRFRVRDPEGALVGPFCASRDQLPDELDSVSLDRFEVTDDNVAPVYVRS